MHGPRITLITDPAFVEGYVLYVANGIAKTLPRGTFGIQLRDKRGPSPEKKIFASRLRELTSKYGQWFIVNGDAALATEVGADGLHLGGPAADTFVGSVPPPAHRRTPVPPAAARFPSPLPPSNPYRPASPSHVAMPDSFGSMPMALPFGSAELAAYEEPSGSFKKGGKGWVSMPAHSEEDVMYAASSGCDAVVVSPIFPTQTHHGVLARGTDALAQARTLAPNLFVIALGGVSVENVRACAQAGAHGAAVITALLQSADPVQDARIMYRAFEARDTEPPPPSSKVSP